MDGQTIRCPNCGSKIPLTEAIQSQIRESLRKEYAEKEKLREQELRKKDEELQRERASAEEARKVIAAEYARKLATEREKLSDEAKKKAREELEVELKDLREEAAERDKKLEAARSLELELRKKARTLEEEKKNMDLELARKIDAEREAIRNQTLEAFSEEHRLKDAEKEKLINDLRKALEDAKRKAEQGSQQTQGEVGELDLEELLKSRFPMDEVEPVPKGVRGADILHKVYTRAGHYCGAVVWEVKRTKAWNDAWIAKLKDDQRDVAAEVAVIVTETMPKGVTNFSMVDGVWVASIPLAGALSEALRAGLVQVAQSRAAEVGKGEKMEAIYGYLSGAEFKHRVEAFVESFRTMKEDLDREKAAITRSWAKREKQIERVLLNTARMYGDLQGIIGASLPEIKALELDSGPAGAGDED